MSADHLYSLRTIPGLPSQPDKPSLCRSWRATWGSQRLKLFRQIFHLIHVLSAGLLLGISAQLNRIQMFESRRRLLGLSHLWAALGCELLTAERHSRRCSPQDSWNRTIQLPLRPFCTPEQGGCRCFQSSGSCWRWAVGRSELQT